jgi:hypothetical protein
VWIPFSLKSSEKRWEPFDFTKHISDKKGFIGNYTEWKGYRYKEDILIFDSHNDIVWYSSILTMCTFDGFKADGAYCRIFSPFGNVTVFAENMYFKTDSTHYLLG